MSSMNVIGTPHRLRPSSRTMNRLDEHARVRGHRAPRDGGDVQLVVIIARYRNSVWLFAAATGCDRVVPRGSLPRRRGRRRAAGFRLGRSVGGGAVAVTARAHYWTARACAVQASFMAMDEISGALRRSRRASRRRSRRRRGQVGCSSPRGCLADLAARRSARNLALLPVSMPRRRVLVKQPSREDPLAVRAIPGGLDPPAPLRPEHSD